MAEEKENPLTREDVLRLIEQNGGTARRLDLSGKVFEDGVDLSKINLEEIILREAILLHAHFEEANLWGAHFEGADLEGAHFEGAKLFFAHLEGARLWFTEFSPDTQLEHVDWGSYILGLEKDGHFTAAESTYRRLKIWHTEHGMYDIAGEFFFREMTAKRKGLEWWPKPWNRALSKLLSILCGYGEIPSRVVISAIVIVFGLAIAYPFGGLSLPYSIYYSAVSFTALGYGSWAHTPEGWVQGVGAAESFIGVFMIALFLVTFVRKMTR